MLCRTVFLCRIKCVKKEILEINECEGGIIMVKTVWALILALILMVSGLAACGRDVVTEENGTAGRTETSGGELRLGLVVIDEEEPLAAAVAVDENGMIVDCVIDQVTEQEGRLVSKNQLGEAYGMKQASPIGKEWNEQAAGFAAYVKGMTAEQVKGIALDENGKAMEPGLLSSATIDLREFVRGVEEAARQAQ